jgi:hypothetical protein
MTQVVPRGQSGDPKGLDLSVLGVSDTSTAAGKERRGVQAQPRGFRSVDLKYLCQVTDRPQATMASMVVMRGLVRGAQLEHQLASRETEGEVLEFLRVNPEVYDLKELTLCFMGDRSVRDGGVKVDITYFVHSPGQGDGERVGEFLVKRRQLLSQSSKFLESYRLILKAPKVSPRKRRSN